MVDFAVKRSATSQPAITAHDTSKIANTIVDTDSSKNASADCTNKEGPNIAAGSFLWMLKACAYFLMVMVAFSPSIFTSPFKPNSWANSLTQVSKPSFILASVSAHPCPPHFFMASHIPHLRYVR